MSVPVLDAKASCTLNDLQVGQVATILGYASGARAYRQKLLAMGLTPGVQIKIHRLAPLGDPIEVIVRGYSLSLRKKESQLLSVQLMDV